MGNRTDYLVLFFVIPSIVPAMIEEDVLIA